MPVELREYGAELHSNLAFEFELDQSHGYGFVRETKGLGAHVVQTGLQAERALVQLAQLLIAKGHIVIDLYGDHLVSLALRGVNNVENTLGFLEQEEGFFKLLSGDKGQGTLV